MQFFKKVSSFDFMGLRKRFMVLSAVLVVAAAVAAFTIGPKFGIDFMGGTEIQVRFEQDAASAQIRETLKDLGFPGAEVVTFGADETEFLIRLEAISLVSDEEQDQAKESFQRAFAGNDLKAFKLSPGGDKLTIELAREVAVGELELAIGRVGLILADRLDEPEEEKPSPDAAEGAVEEDKRAKRCEGVTCTWPGRNEQQVYEVNLKGVSERVMEGFRARDFGKGAKKMRSEWVGPKVGEQLRVAGISSIVYALLFIMLYIAVRFDLRFAPGAVVALIHDVMITIGVFTLARVEVTLATIAALLTIVGYSLNDTIVVFDRIRENISKSRERKLVHVINVSINETLSRTVLTSLTTLIVVVVLLTVGWKTTIRDFAFALLIGVLVGTYSSIFIASPIVVWLDRRFGKKKV